MFLYLYAFLLFYTFVQMCKKLKGHMKIQIEIQNKSKNDSKFIQFFIYDRQDTIFIEKYIVNPRGIFNNGRKNIERNG